MKFRVMTLADMEVDVANFSVKVPKPLAVVGVPRTGVLVATMLALRWNIPLVPLEMISALPDLPRRSRDYYLLVDDSAWTGNTLRACDPRRPDVRAGVLYKRPALEGDLVRYFLHDHPSHPQFYKHALMHDPIAGQIMWDLDGVFCEDWHGDEVTQPFVYLRHLVDARETDLPTAMVGWIVSGRMDRHQAETERWLASRKIEYGTLLLCPADDVPARDAKVARHKAAAYVGSSAVLFVESCITQAKEIAELAGKPVLHWGTSQVFGNQG